MPDISKINAVAVADIEKLDSILAANIEKVNGLTFATAPAVSAPAAAYSVRLLDSALGVPTYTGAAMRVRRETAGGAGDDDEADIAFDSGVISLDSAISNASAGVTATTLGQFLNVGTVNGTTYTNPDSLTVTASCSTDTWYDQSGNANHAEQTTQGSQPQIHDGTVDTDLITENGKPAIRINRGFSQNLNNTGLGCSGKEQSYFYVYKATNTSFHSQMKLWLHGGGVTARAWYLGYRLTSSQGTNDYSNNIETNVQRVLSVLSGATPSTAADYELYRDGSLLTPSSASSQTVLDITDDNFTIGGAYIGINFFQEIVVYNSDQSSNRTAIEENINSNYLIYQPTDQPTSGLLYDYGSATGGTDAAAAYSVRQLSDKAILCMRIRRDMGVGNPGDDDEINIGFDANGDLDTQAIADFCTTGTGYVTRWWDQSVNGNHADQPVGGTGSNVNQPQIYDGTAVIEENGKPALQFDGTDSLRKLFTSDKSQPNHFFTTATLNSTSAAAVLLSGHSNTFERNQTELTSSGFWSMYAQASLTSTTSGDTSQHLHNNLFNATSSAYYLDGNSIVTGNAGTFPTDGLTIGARYTQTLGWNGTIQEFVFYNSDQSSNRTGIETDINTYFSIYT